MDSESSSYFTSLNLVFSSYNAHSILTFLLRLSKRINKITYIWSIHSAWHISDFESRVPFSPIPSPLKTSCFSSHRVGDKTNSLPTEGWRCEAERTARPAFGSDFPAFWCVPSGSFLRVSVLSSANKGAGWNSQVLTLKFSNLKFIDQTIKPE